MPNGQIVAVGKLIDRFLEETKKTRKPSTYSWYENYLRNFKYCCLGMPPDKVTPQMVYNWIAINYGSHSPSTQHTAARAVVRAMNWAVDEGLIPQSPLRKFRKPTPSHREIVISPADYALMLRCATAELQPVIKFLWHTGCRPQELRIIESRHVQGRKIVLPRSQSKGRRRQRVIYLDTMMQRVVAYLVQRRPEGPLFRDSREVQWSANGLVHAFARLRSRTGIPGLCAYAIRHTFITRLLEQGHDAASVAAIVGNSPRMVLDVYNHVAQNETRLLAMLG